MTPKRPLFRSVSSPLGPARTLRAPGGGAPGHLLGPLAAAWTLGAVLGFGEPARADETVRFIVEERNDAEFDAYPPPGPVEPVEASYEITSEIDEAVVDVPSRRVRNLSVTIENLGPGLVSEPYLRGPRGWDFRDLGAIAGSITAEPGLTGVEKFYRVHEWKGLHVVTVLGSSYAPYLNADFSGNPLRVLNQYGYAMCGQSTSTTNNILLRVEPEGSFHGRVAKLGSHRTGEAFFDGAWHAFDTTPGTGVVQWIYYGRDNETIAPTWKHILADPFLATRVKAWTGASVEKYLPEGTGETFEEARAFPEWDFNYDLRPGESLTMHHQMRGRLDLTSARHNNSEMYRCYSDYGSAVFTYRPDLAGGSYLPYATEAVNVVSTPLGLEPRDPSQPAYVVFERRSTWCLVGADIQASFPTTGSVSIAVNADPYDLRYPSNPKWTRLIVGKEEYGDRGIEGKMVYWVKLEFQGPGSGLRSATISSEVQMSPWSMPSLAHGRNRLLFSARDLGGSRVRVTHRFDAESPFHFQDATTSPEGRVIPIRIGGILQQGSKLGSSDYRKGAFWRRLRGEPGVEVATRVEILRMRGANAGGVVRTLVDRRLPYGMHEFYWDGRDDGGSLLEAGPYAYRLTINGKVIHGERLYLYSSLWPPVNDPPGPSEPPPPGFEADAWGGAAVPEGGELTYGDGESPWSQVVDSPPKEGTGGATEPEPVDPPAADGPPADGPAAEEPGVAAAQEPGLDGGATVAEAVLDGEVEHPLDGDQVVPEPAGTLSIERLRARLRLERRAMAVPDVLDLRAWVVAGGATAPEWLLQPGAPLPPAGTSVRVVVGGVERRLVLDRRGRGRSEDRALTVSFQTPRKEGDPPGLRVKVKLRGAWADEWADEGFFPAEEARGEPLNLAVPLELDDQVFATDVLASLDTVPETKAILSFPAR